MKKLILVSMLSFATLGMFSMVSASDCPSDGFGGYSCEVGQYCSGGVQCDCPSGPINPGDVCGVACPSDGFGGYSCEVGQYCSGGVQCDCPSGPINPGDVCGGSSTPIVCIHAGETFYEGESRQRFLSGPVLSYGNSCVAGTVTCTASGQPTGHTGYNYTGCIVDPTPPVVTGSCNLLGYGTMLSGDVLTGFSQNTASSCGVACPSYNTIVCLDGVLSGGNNYDEIQYSNCNTYGCGGGGGGGGGGSSTPTCELEDLICVDGIYEEAEGVNCRYGELGDECEMSEEFGTGSNDDGDLYDFTRIGDISNSPYSSELNLAYLYAYNMGITTMDNILDANMEGNLIRSHMAKMLVERAINVRGLEANTEITCDFDDIAGLQGEDLYDFVIQSCQMGLMGLDSNGNPSDSFNPYNTVTRAQFGTVLSRAIWGDYYNGGTPYYTDHLDVLHTVEIMNDISDPYMFELRGYVMLMLLRANQLLN